jgi:hypothetical protein
VPRRILEKYCKSFYMLGTRSSRIGMREKIFLAAKCWCRMRHLNKDETARQYYEWHEMDIEIELGPKTLSAGVRQNSFVIWQDQNVRRAKAL